VILVCVAFLYQIFSPNILYKMQIFCSVVVCVNVNRASFFMNGLIDHSRFTPPYGYPALLPQPWGHGMPGFVPLEVMRGLYPQFQDFGPKPKIHVLESGIDPLAPPTDPQ
jgi:hypothetical protein